jgi:hypothetical protein
MMLRFELHACDGGEVEEMGAICIDTPAFSVTVTQKVWGLGLIFMAWDGVWAVGATRIASMRRHKSYCLDFHFASCTKS